jgi:predicted RNA-binding Zn-ribbon protein involved in translation (DUF1610 family)
MKMNNESVRYRGPLRSTSDKNLSFGPCSWCGFNQITENISRIPCEKCGHVICWRCADCGVFGSLSDFQKFICAKDSEADRLYLKWDNCPYCLLIPWHAAKEGYDYKKLIRLRMAIAYLIAILFRPLKFHKKYKEKLNNFLETIFGIL